MTLWKVDRVYRNYTKRPGYIVSPYDLKGHLKACIEIYGWEGLRWCYLFKWQAELKAKSLDKKERRKR